MYSEMYIGNHLSNRISVVWHVIGVKPLVALLEHVLSNYLRMSNFIPLRLLAVLMDNLP